jgi:hypothetical protein
MPIAGRFLSQHAAHANGLTMKQPTKPDDQPPGPRRGAIPTPKKIIEEATPYVPGETPARPPDTPAPAKPKAQ